MDIKGAEIFASGKWNGLEFSDSDLDEIVANFDTLKEIHKVPLKLGHNDEQKVTDGQPALGWVERIYKQGNKLLADFADVPKTIYESIKKRLYRTVSVELLFNVNHGGSKYNHVLDAVALLGADHPAVNTLSDLEALLATRAEFSGGRRVVFETIAGNRKQEDNTMPEISKEDFQKLQASVDSLIRKVDEKDQTITELTQKLEASEKKGEEFARKQKEKEISDKRAEVKALLDTAVKDKKMVPAVRETYAKQIGLDDDERVLTIDTEQVKIMCSATKGVDDGRETALDGDRHKYDNAEDELIRLTNKAMAENGSDDFIATFSRVSAAHPKLHKEYLDSNGIKRSDRAED